VGVFTPIFHVLNIYNKVIIGNKMSKMTDRLDNSNLVNLVRQNYEAKQKLRIPPVLVKLPSNGLIYPESSPLRSGTIEMRHMTAYDEDILTNSTYINAGIVLDKLLESVIVTPGVDVDDISSTDKDGLIIAARIHGYGKDYPVIVKDPKTNKELQRNVDLSKINFKPFNLIADENGEFEYKITLTDDTIKFRFITGKLSKKIDPERAISNLMENTIMEINGNRDKNYISDFVKYEMTAGAGREFRKYLTDNMPGLDFKMQFEGEDGSTFETGFQVGADLFWF
jgi:hypothetical protein